MQHTFKLSLIAGLILSTSAMAEEGFRQHDAHVHGHVEFNIAQDGNELLVEIAAPGADIVGFEHAPENEAQHELIEKAEKSLMQADKVLLLSSAAGCSTEHVSVKNTLEEDEHHDEHDHEKHDDHDKHDEHNHDKHDDHKDHDHESHEHEGEGEGHGEFTIEYHFECSDIAKLNRIKTNWFKLFPNSEEVEVNLLTDTAQNAFELNKNKTVIKF
ncbi:zinc uptake protein ZrgA [Vibrio sp. SCSIO 43137]|uniref:zinc uptake protein ZrgA n=1 Tax=Vibrio sp. SCSIO 43137 TaxID=3021011 RepID=UPI002308222B|nr:DUF2796 domain-containing protein [Vibrio sp. SCSIO 43137]WCE29431.1 DUF2796 domain-containing protein [Vibrio sp. SCSIO 43137]